MPSNTRLLQLAVDTVPRARSVSLGTAIQPARFGVTAMNIRISTPSEILTDMWQSTGFALAANREGLAIPQLTPVIEMEPRA